MANMPTLIAVLLLPKGVVFWCVTAAAGMAAAIVFLINAGNRDSIDKAMKIAANGSSPIGMFEYCSAMNPQAVEKRALVVAQHPNFQLSTSWQADYPIFRGKANAICLHWCL